MTEAARILVVDDDPEILAMVARVLGERGYEVKTALGGEQAFDEVRRWGHSPDVVLLDLMMPGMSGWEFCARCRKEPAFASTAFVFMSAHERKLRESTSSVARTLTKPFQMATLCDTVRDAVEEAKQRKKAPRNEAR